MQSKLLAQNDPELLKYLQASSVAYSSAKSKEFLFSYGLFFLSIAYPICYFYIKDEGTKQILFALSFVMTILSWVFADYFKGNTTKGALYKEMFDVRLFALPWKFMLPRPDNAEVLKLAKKYNGSRIQDWYPKEISDKIPANTVIAICQRVNSGWDIELRSKYKTVLIILIVIYSICIFLFWTTTGQNGNLVFSLYFSTLSYYAHIITLIRGNSNTIEKRRKIVNKLDPFIEEKKEITLDQLRDVQDEIFGARQEPSKVPNTIFNIYNKELLDIFSEYVVGVNKIYENDDK